MADSTQSSEIQSAGERLIDETKKAGERVKNQGQGIVAAQKDRLATEIAAVGDAIGQSARRLREEHHNEQAAHYVEQVASKVQQAADYIGDYDVGSVLNRVEKFARERPELFFGGMFLAGIAVARFLKTSRANEPNWSGMAERAENMGSSAWERSDDMLQRTQSEVESMTI